MFVNLYSDAKAGAAFREHNFTYFLGNLDRVAEDWIKGAFAERFRTNDWEPEIAATFEFSLSERACRSFLRLHPGLPAIERDYYLSKLFQYLKLSVDEALKHDAASSDDPNGWARKIELYRTIEETLDDIEVSLIAHFPHFDWFAFQRDMIRSGDDLDLLLSGPWGAYLKNESVEYPTSAARESLRAQRKKLLEAYRLAVPGGTYAAVRKAAKVDGREFRKWQHGELPDKSAPATRLERAFRRAIEKAAKFRGLSNQ